MAGKTNSGDFPTLGSRGIVRYVDSEDLVQRAYGNLWSTRLLEVARGNLHSQVQSDLVTLSDRGKWQSIGHTGVCPKTGMPFTIATGVFTFVFTLLRFSARGGQDQRCVRRRHGGAVYAIF